MKRTFVIQIMSIVMILSACGGGAPAETSTSTVALTFEVPVTGATETETPNATETSIATTPTLEFTATPEATRPPNAADCTNLASFMADVSIPDNMDVGGGATFTKTWRVLNAGTCIWASDYKLTHYSEERMNAVDVPLSVTYPGQSLDISVELTAPNVVGSHRGYFVIQNPAGLVMKVNEDSRLWVIITVTNLSAATQAPAPTTVSATNTSVSSSTAGFATVSCAFSIDQAKLLEVLNAVNAYRAQEGGMPAYTVNQKLAQAALAHASDMACNQLTGDTGSNGSTAESRVTASGYVASFVRENVYASNTPISGQDVVNLWVNDTNNTSNRLNLVSDSATEIGIGYASFNNSVYYVIVFASP